jgi:phosphatidylethanolamine/phosphatidyl-N-methylethanolamine N-methyltransferase
LDTVLEGTDLHVARKQKVNPLRLWALVECVNAKNGHVVKHGNASAGYVSGNGSASYANGHNNGTGHFANGHSH